MTDPLIGTTFARYRIESRLGAGGMGVVYRAIDERLDRPVALKVLAADRAADPVFRERFLGEARRLASLRHRHIVTVYEADEWQGRLYLAMDYIAGAELGQLIERDGPLEPARAVDLVGQVADALDAAHAAGLVHRDVKPGNILVEAGPAAAEQAYLADFGLTRPVGGPASGLTMAGQFVGTPGYVAPEQIEGKDGVDHRADVYALGCVLYNALTGDIPYPRDSTMGVLWAHMWEPAPRVSAVQPRLEPFDTVLATALAKSPADRYQTAGALAAAARRALADLVPSATPPPAGPGAPGPPFNQTLTDHVRPSGPRPNPPPAGPPPVTPRQPPGGPPPTPKPPGQLPPPASARKAPPAVLAAAGIILAVAAGGFVLSSSGWFAARATDPAPSSTPAATAGPTRAPTPTRVVEAPSGGEIELLADGDTKLATDLEVTIRVVTEPTDDSGVAAMAIANAPVRPSNSYPYQTTDLQWELAAGVAGPRTVYIWFQNNLGVWTPDPVTETITFDNPPVARHGVFDRTGACGTIRSKGYVILPIIRDLVSDPDPGDEVKLVRAWKGDIDFRIVDGRKVKIHLDPRSNFNAGSFIDHYAVEDEYGVRSRGTFELRVGPCP